MLLALLAMAAVAGGLGVWYGRRLRQPPAAQGLQRALASRARDWSAEALDLLGTAVFVWDPARGKGLYCNARAAALYGQTSDTFLTATFGPAAAMTDVPAEDRGALRAAYAAAAAGQGGQVEFRLNVNGRERRIQETIRPLKDPAGQVTHVLCAASDVTALHRRNRSGAEAEMMQSLGRMASGISHDFNNILAVILGNLELLGETADAAERDEIVREAIGATERGRDLTRTMLGYARRTPERLRPVDLNAAVREMAPLLRRTIPENIRIDYALQDGVWPIVGDRSLADSALLNLSLNARDAMPAGGQLTISTEIDTGGGTGPRTVLQVEDTGTGIDPAVQARLFDPFVSSKGTQRNSGLGLAMVQSFVRQAGGEVDVRSRPGVGSCFRLFFPAIAAEGEPRPPACPSPAGPRTRPARILVMEDNDSVRDMLTRQLRRAGHSVEAVPDGAAGERAFHEAGPFELLLADLVVPGTLQGPDLAERLLRRNPALRVLFVSAYARPDVMLKHPLLRKPLSRKDLLQAVSRALA